MYFNAGTAQTCGKIDAELFLSLLVGQVTSLNGKIASQNASLSSH